MLKDIERSIAFLLSLLFFSSVQADRLPAPFSAYYRGVGSLASACVTLSHEQGGLRYEFRSKFLWRKFHESSTLRVEGGSFYPVEFLHSEKDPARNIRTLFDWSQGTVRTVVGQTQSDEKLPENKEVWDLLSVQLKLMADLRQHNEATEFVYHVVNKRGRIKLYRMQVLGLEKIKTKEGYYDVLKIERVSKKRALYLWLAPKLGYLPIKIKQRGVSMKLYSRSCGGSP